MSDQQPERLTRRGFFERAVDGLHGAALTYLLSKDLFGASALPFLVARPEAAAADWPALSSMAARLLGARVTLIAAEGRVLGDSEVPRERLGEVENHANRPEVQAALAGRIGRASRRSRTIDQDLRDGKLHSFEEAFK